MVDMEDAEGHSPREGSKGSRRKSKRQVCWDDGSIPCGGVLTEDPSQSRPRPDDEDDAVMVDPYQANPPADVMSGPDDMTFVDAPPRERRLKRSNTAPPKKQESGGFMGLLDSLRKGTRPDRPERPEMPERRKSRSYRDDDARHPPEMDRDGARRSRREDRRRGSVRPDTDAEGFVTDVPGAGAGGETEADEAEARRAARHSRRGSRKAPSDSRENEAREAEERRARRKERAREQRAREEEEEERLREEDRLREEKRARRAAREERRAREEQAAREAEAEAEAAAEAKAAERRERRRLREEEMMAARGNRRREREQRIPDEVFPDERDVDRREARSSRAFEEPTARRRKSKVAPEPTREPLMTGGLNRGGGGGKDKISSWVYSQSDEPPEPPQIVPTLIDLPPLAADDAGNAHSHSLSSDEEARRAVRRKARRRAKYEEEIDDARSRHRGSRREGVKSSSGSGDYERDRGMRSQPGSRHGGAPPSSGAKKPSWFRKLTNL